MDHQLPVPPEAEQPGICLHFHVAEPQAQWSRARLDVAERDAQLIGYVADHLARIHLSPTRRLLRVEAVDPCMDRVPRRWIEERQHFEFTAVRAVGLRMSTSIPPALRSTVRSRGNVAGASRRLDVAGLSACGGGHVATTTTTQKKAVPFHVAKRSLFCLPFPAQPLRRPAREGYPGRFGVGESSRLA